ncbi:MAG: S-methyl-5'-thioadenosine phosphorylase, partial [Mycobacteriaceae bacterium]|nr:S-methyl-5'-thioadenosine phosphorylase [Mycobacteriaceae bacterium]
EFERNLGPFKQVVLEAIASVPAARDCTHCLPHDGVELPFELP